jgi:hypothetical protein
MRAAGVFAVPTGGELLTKETEAIRALRARMVFMS